MTKSRYYPLSHPKSFFGRNYRKSKQHELCISKDLCFKQLLRRISRNVHSTEGGKNHQNNESDNVHSIPIKKHYYAIIIKYKN